MVIGNPPYGATLKDEEKKIYKEKYITTKSIRGIQKGSMDSYTIFIELGYNILSKNGNLSYIVPISVTSSDALSGVHRLLEGNCKEIRVSSYAVRPQPVFENAVVNTSILSFIKTNTPNEVIFSTKMYRKGKGFNLQSLINNLQFAEVKDLKLFGRIPKIGSEIEKSILTKIFRHYPINSYLDINGKNIYYRFAGGRYFKIITNYPTNSSAERALTLQKDKKNAIGCILSSSLSFWFYQIYSDNLNWKNYEILSFTIPKLSINTINKLEYLYELYLADIENNANIRTTSGRSSYNVSQFKEYKIGKSKHIIDQIDDIICPLYGLTAEETDFIKNYELEFRISEEN